VRGLRHAAAVVAGYAALFIWLYARPLLEGSYLAETDLFDFYLPIFLAPLTIWSSFEFAGVPAFVNPENSTFYPLHLLFARVVGSWTLYLTSAFVLAASFTYAYVYAQTRSKLASALAGLAYGLSEAMMERISHATVIHAMVWLPAILLALDSLRLPSRGHWLAIGSISLACMILAGHPQFALYGGGVAALYACGIALIERPSLRYPFDVALMFLAGVLLAAGLVVPFAEARALLARDVIGFGQFVSHANTPWQMLSLFVPAIEHEGREAPTYVGLAVLMLSIVAVCRRGRGWRGVFWAAVGAVALALGAGDATPLAGWAYQVPLYDQFRVVARHLTLAAFALAVLAGFGLAAILRREVSRVVLAAGVCAVLGALVAAAVVIAAWPGQFAFERDVVPLPVWNSAVWSQCGIGLACAVVMVAVREGRRAGVLAFGLLGIVAGDLLHALPYTVGPAGLRDAVTAPASAIEPSVHVRRLADTLGYQRVLRPGGAPSNDVLPSLFTRPWRVAVADGYTSVLIARHATLAMMGTSGVVDRQLLAGDNAALDVLAVKYMVMPARELDRGSDFERDGLVWSARPLDMSVGPAECGQRYPRAASYALPRGVAVREVVLMARLACSEDVPQGTTVATVQVATGGNVVLNRPLRAGVEIAERGLDDPRLAARARHRIPSTVVDRDAGQLSYLLRLELPRAVEDGRLTIDVTGTAGWLEIHRLTVVDAAGNSHPVAEPDMLLTNSVRWRVVDRFSTSRESDRASDEDAPGEVEYVVLENLRALPRAWLTTEVIPLKTYELGIALHHSYLPDGRRYDPGRMALVEPGTLPPATFGAGESTVDVLDVEDGRVRLSVSSPGGGLLVLSETFYPGWRVRVGDAVLPVQRVNMSLQGVVVPSGRHAVTFEFASGSLKAGAATSALTLVLLIGVPALVRARKRVL
jgi:hypothetical protein